MDFDSMYSRIESLGCFNYIHEDRNFAYFYFYPNKNGGIYGIKLKRDGFKISGVMLVSMFDVDIEFEDLLANISEEDSGAILFNLEILSGNMT